MRIVFMGTPAFAASILEDLSQQHEVVAVYTRPDAVRGRGKKLVASPVKEAALRLNIPVFEPKTLRDEKYPEELAALAPDAICVAAYGAILPAEVLSVPRFGCLNVHASLLPRWRGAAPVERAILAGDDEVGVCIMRMEEGLDTGPYCVCRTLAVEDRGAAEVTDALAALGANALLTALVHVECGRAEWVSQDDSQATYADKIKKNELYLDPFESETVLVRKVRASGEAHPARCIIDGRSVTVQGARGVTGDDSAEETLRDLQPGKARFCAKRLFLGCSDGAVEVLSLKPDGKNTMDARAFVAGSATLRERDAAWEKKHV